MDLTHKVSSLVQILFFIRKLFINLNSDVYFGSRMRLIVSKFAVQAETKFDVGVC